MHKKLNILMCLLVISCNNLVAMDGDGGGGPAAQTRAHHEKNQQLKLHAAQEQAKTLFEKMQRLNATHDTQLRQELFSELQPFNLILLMKYIMPKC